MKRTFLLSFSLLLAVVSIGLGADNTGAGPVYSSGNPNQIQKASKDIGSGVQADVVIAVDSSGVAIASATTVKSTALEASHVLKASAGSLVSFHAYNSKASAQYILIMDSATVTADGAVVLLYPPIYVPATSNVSLNFTTPLSAANGISVANSSTGSFTKTIGSADCVFVAQVK